MLLVPLFSVLSVSCLSTMNCTACWHAYVCTIVALVMVVVSAMSESTVPVVRFLDQAQEAARYGRPHGIVCRDTTWQQQLPETVISLTNRPI